MTCVFDFFLALLFFSRILYLHFDIKNTSENARKIQEKCEKITQTEKSMRKCFYITLRIG